MDEDRERALKALNSLEVWSSDGAQSDFCDEDEVIKFVKEHFLTIRTALQANQWRDISSAPRDGTWLMGWWPHMRIDQYPCAVFYDHGVYQNPNAWTLASDLEYGEVYPTLWKPLDLPPKPTGEG